MDESSFTSFIKEWWGFLAFLAGALAAFVTGREHQRFRINQVGEDVNALKKEVESLRQQITKIRSDDAKEAVQAAAVIAELGTDIKYMRKSIDELRNALRGKADK